MIYFAIPSTFGCYWIDCSGDFGIFDSSSWFSSKFCFSLFLSLKSSWSSLGTSEHFLSSRATNERSIAFLGQMGTKCATWLCNNALWVMSVRSAYLVSTIFLKAWLIFVCIQNLYGLLIAPYWLSLKRRPFTVLYCTNRHLRAVLDTTFYSFQITKKNQVLDKNRNKVIPFEEYLLKMYSKLTNSQWCNNSSRKFTFGLR